MHILSHLTVKNNAVQDTVLNERFIYTFCPATDTLFVFLFGPYLTQSQKYGIDGKWKSECAEELNTNQLFTAHLHRSSFGVTLPMILHFLRWNIHLTSVL